MLEGSPVEALGQGAEGTEGHSRTTQESQGPGMMHPRPSVLRQLRALPRGSSSAAVWLRARLSSLSSLRCAFCKSVSLHQGTFPDSVLFSVPGEAGTQEKTSLMVASVLMLIRAESVEGGVWR